MDGGSYFLAIAADQKKLRNKGLLAN